MILDTKLLLEHGADGIAFGFLKEDQTLDTERTKEVIYLIHEQGREAVFHRAFDCVADQKKTIEQLIGLGADQKNYVVTAYFQTDRKSTRLNSSHTDSSRMPSSA